MSDPILLTLNAGSSSIKFAVFAAVADPVELARGQVESIGAAARLKLMPAEADPRESTVDAPDHAAAIDAILVALESLFGDRSVHGVGHRIVHGGPDFVAPARLTDAAIDALEALVPLAPLHQPHNLAAVRAARTAFPEAMQIGCFDTAFHRAHPWVSDTFALPASYYDAGLRRYGFHGLSYQSVIGSLREIAPDAAQGRVIVAHLGNGASICAMRDGRSIESSMGFSVLDGLPMGTRCGQIDPGALLYLLEEQRLTPAQVSRLLYHESGLLGLSGISNDMRTLESSGAPAADRAIAYFAHRLRREIGALAATLGGLDALVFCGGIGENSARLRHETCATLGWLGIALDAERNAAHATESGTGAVRVFVIRTDEEREIASAVAQALTGG